MKRERVYVGAVCALALAALVCLPATKAQNFTTKVHGDDNGNALVIEPGGSLKVPAFGTAGTGVTINTRPTGDYGLRKVVLTFSNVSIATVDQGTNGAQGSLNVFTLPAGKWGHLLAARVNLTTLAGSGGIVDGAALVGSLGVMAAGTGDAILTSLEANVVGSVAGTLTSGAGTLSTVSQSTIMLGSAIDDVYLNLAIPNADSSADDTVTVNGTITLWFVEVP